MAATICTIELLTYKLDYRYYKGIVRGYFQAIFIIIVLEFIRNFAASVLPSAFKLDQGKNILLIMYVILTGVNSVYFCSVSQLRYEKQVITKPVIVSMNIIALVITLMISSLLFV
jgi:hypothetical protein